MNEYTVALYVIGVHSIYSEWGIGIMSLYSPMAGISVSIEEEL